MTTKKVSKEKVNLNLLSAFGEASSLSFSIVLYPVIFLLLGVYADKKLDTTPLFIILGILAGLVAFVVRVYQLTKKLRGQHE